jgi:hypothetical protein
MKKLGYVVAALGAIAIAAPTIASAETIITTGIAPVLNIAFIVTTAGIVAGTMTTIAIMVGS